MTSYKAEQRYFNVLKADMSDEAQKEYELAVNTVVSRFNTSVLENRFTVGGAVEVFTYALLRSVGIECYHNAAQATGGDITLPDKKELSIKGSFAGISSIGLINKRGGGYRKWTTATLFVISGVGIVFGAPDMVDADDINDAQDQIQLKKKGLQKLVNDDRNVIPLNIANKPPKEKAGESKRQSMAVARLILNEKKLGALLNHLDRD